MLRVQRLHRLDECAMVRSVEQSAARGLQGKSVAAE